MQELHSGAPPRSRASWRIWAAAIVVGLLLASLALALVQPPTSRAAISTPWLHVEGNWIKDPNGNRVVLRGAAIIDLALADATRPGGVRGLIDRITNEANGWYPRVIRLSVYPNAEGGWPSQGWNANPDAYFTQHLDPAVQYCVSKGIYCIVDWHYISDYNTPAIDSTTRAFWTYVAPRYNNTPNVLYELFNEPINPDNWDTWRATAQPWVDLIRSYAPNNLILVGAPSWSQHTAGAINNPFTGGNIVYTAHIYAEHPPSQWDTWFGNTANYYPVMITEWGWQAGGAVPTNGTRTSFGVPFQNYIESKPNIGWSAWVADNEWGPVMFDANWNLLGGENYEGQFVKDWLYTKRNSDLPGGSGPTPTPTTPPSTTNLLANGGIEAGTFGWNCNNCTLTAVTSPVRTGARALKITNRAAAWAGPQQSVGSKLVNGAAYTTVAWVRLPSGTANALVTLAITAGGTTNYITLAPSTPVNATGWTKLTGTVTVTWSGALSSATWYVETASGTTNFYLDDARFYRP